MAKRLLAGLVAAAALIGMKFYNKASTHDDVKARLVELCAGDAECQAAVNTHFEACFESSYKMGGRRQSSRLDVDAFVKCVNTKAGQPYFVASNEEK
jgi:hypothetical protein